MTLRYVATRQRDRYRVFDGRTFLGVVERPRMEKHGEMMPWWGAVVHKYGARYWNVHLTRTEAAEALREMRGTA